jgi:hypothetical protein
LDAISTPSVITAISDPDFEGLVSSTLFSQGWNVIARALDIHQLRQVLASNELSNILVIFSTDLAGAGKSDFQSLTQESYASFGFADQNGNDFGLMFISQRPTSPEQFLLLIMENLRNAPGRAALLQPSAKCLADVISIGGVRHSTGSTTLAINLAQELSLLGQHVLLVDANFLAPSIANSLDLRNLKSEVFWRSYSAKLSVMELTQEKVGNFSNWITEAGDTFDIVVIDHGSLSHFDRELSDRRWSSQIKIWSARNSEHFLITTNSELLTQIAQQSFSHEFFKLSLPTKVHFVNMGTVQRGKSREKNLRNEDNPGQRSFYLPWDRKACQAALAERSTLAQTLERCSLRKELISLAQELSRKTHK